MHVADLNHLILLSVEVQGTSSSPFVCTLMHSNCSIAFNRSEFAIINTDNPGKMVCPKHRDRLSHRVCRRPADRGRHEDRRPGGLVYELAHQLYVSDLRPAFNRQTDIIPVAGQMLEALSKYRFIARSSSRIRQGAISHSSTRRLSLRPRMQPDKTSLAKITVEQNLTLSSSLTRPTTFAIALYFGSISPTGAQ